MHQANKELSIILKSISDTKQLNGSKVSCFDSDTPRVLLKKLSDFLSSSREYAANDVSLKALLDTRAGGGSNVGRGYHHGNIIIQKKIIEKIAEFLEKKPSQVTEDDVVSFRNFAIISASFDSDIFDFSIKDIFVAYVNAKKVASVYLSANIFDEDEIKEKNIYENFIKFYTPEPWVVINQAMEDTGLKYRISEPSITDLNTFSPKLTHNITNQVIFFNELSSGEKILFKLALALFSSEKINLFPELLLLDEVDASLHPEMIVKFFDIIQKTFIERYGVKVIVATHSPTTVAIADDANLFTIENGKVRQSSKRESLANLLSGVPNLGVLYENKKQVFVESKYDEFFYSSLDSVFKLQNETNSVLNFISSGTDGSGSSSQVKTIVSELVRSGVPSVYGIIDWDAKNSSSQNIYVLGENSRYSRENYTFDPLCVGLLVIHNGLFLPSDENWFKDLTSANLHNTDLETLQKIYDYMLVKLPSDVIADDTRVSVKLVNDYELLINKNIMGINGHNFAKIWLENYNVLKKYRKAEDYEKDIYRVIFKNFSQFIWKDLYNILHIIHSIPIQQK